MADPKQNKKPEKVTPTSEEAGFKTVMGGFDKNEVNMYINKLKKQMKEQQQESESRMENMRKNLEDANDELNSLRSAARDAANNGGAPAAAAAPSSAHVTDSEIIKATKEAEARVKKESDAKIMELRKLVLDERRNVAKLDKECAMAQMSEKKVREEYAKLKEKYSAVKKSAGGGKAVVNSNADEVIDEIIAEAEKLAKEIIASADSYAKSSVESVNAYKAKVEAELKTRSDKLAEAKKKLDEQAEKAKSENETAQKHMKEIAEKIAAVTGSLGTFAASFESVNTQITAVTSQIDSVTGQFGTVSQQINDATSAIDGVSRQFDDVSKQMTTAVESISGITQTMTAAADSIGGVTKQFTDVSGKLTAAKDSFGTVSDSLEKAKASFGDVTKTVNETKNGIAGIKSGAEAAAGLTTTASAGGADAAALTSVSEAIGAATAGITAEIALPEFKPAFDKSRLDELKKKLKIETTYEGGEAIDDDDEDEDILSSIEIDEIPDSPVPTDDELMADLPAIEPDPVPESEPEPVKTPEPKAEPKKSAPANDDLSDFFITPTTDDASNPLINTSGVGAIDDFSLDSEPEPLGDDFDLAPNDLSATPDKGMDLGEDIFNMASGVDINDDTLGSMMAEQKKKDEEGDFMLTPAEIDDEYKHKSSGMNDDFGEFADLFAAGSAETTATPEKKKKNISSSSDDPFNFGMDGSGDDADMSADSDLSDLLL